MRMQVASGQEKNPGDSPAFPNHPLFAMASSFSKWMILIPFPGWLPLVFERFLIFFPSLVNMVIMADIIPCKNILIALFLTSSLISFQSA